MRIYGADISGSLSVSGSAEIQLDTLISGSLTVLGGINASISGNITNAQTADNAPRYTLTTSFNNFTSSYNTGSFTGFFKGDGSGLTNIPASGVTGLNLSQISQGSATASITQANGLRINTNTEVTGTLKVTGGIYSNGLGLVSGSDQFTGSYDQRYVLSGSITQTTWDNIANKPPGIVSGSDQVNLTGTTGFSTFSSSLATTDSNQDNRLSTIESTTASLNTYTSSTNTKLGSLEAASASIRSDFNTYTSSNDTTNTTQNSRLASLESTSASLNTYTSSNTTNINAIHTATSSLNTFSSSVLGAIEVTGSNLTVKGNLLVKGTTTQIDSTTVNIGDNIISLNGTAATNAGIQVQDASGVSTVSGSLLWDATTDNWKAGKLGSEERIILANEYNTFSTSIDSRATSLETSRTALNLYTASNNSRLTAIETSTGSLNTFSASANSRLGSLETASGSIRSDFNSYTSSNDTTNTTQNSRLSSLESTTGSLNTYTSSNNTVIGTLQTATSSLNSYTSSTNTRLGVIETTTSSLNTFTSSASGRLTSLESASSSIRSDFNTYTSSNNTRVSNIESTTSSLNTFTSSASTRLTSIETSTGSLNTFSSSANSRLTSIEMVTSSLNSYTSSNNTVIGTLQTATSSLNTYTSSNNTRVNAIESTTASLNTFTSSASGRLSSLETASGSIRTDFNSYTSSNNTVIGTLQTATSSLNSYTSSNNTRLNTIESTTSSLNTFTSSASGRLTSLESASSSIRSDFNTYTSSNNTTNTTQNSRLSALETTTGSLNTYTSSNNTRVSTIESTTASLNTFTSSASGRLTSLETASGSIRSDFNTYTSSANGRLSAIETSTGSLNTFSSSATGRLNSLESTSSSLLSFSASVATGIEFTGSNVTIKGNLNVKGTTTTINSTTVDIADNIIQLNGAGTANAGLVVRDATSPNTVSGSLLWDSTNDKWIAGALGSEQTIVLDGQLNTFTASANSRLTSIESTTASINTYTASNTTNINAIHTATSSLNTFTSSASSRLSALETASGSIRTDFNSYTSSNNTVIGTLQTATSSLNSYTSSNNTRLGVIESTTASLNTFTSSASSRLSSLETASGSIRSDFNAFTSSNAVTESGQNTRLSALETTTGSLNTYTSSNNTVIGTLQTATGALNTFTSSASSRLTALEATTGSLNSYTSSNNTVIGTLQTATSSLNTYTSSTNTRLGVIEGTTASLNTFTSSANTRLSSIETATGSLNSYTSSNNTVIGTLQTATSSLNTFTSSANTRLSAIESSTSSLNTYTSSNNNRLGAIETTTSSLNTFTSSASGRLSSLETASGSIRSDFNAFTSSNNATESAQNTRLSALETTTGSLNSYTSSNNIVIGALQTATSSLNTFTSSAGSRLTAIESTTSSLNSYTSSNNTVIGTLQTATSSLNTFTSSAGGRLTAIESTTSSLNTYTSSNNTVIGTLQSSTSSLNTFTSSASGRLTSIESTTSSLNTFSTSVATAIETTGSNLTVKGNLLVKGTTTQVDSTIISVGDNIIQLNGTGATNAGLVVRDATAPNTASGSLLWDTTNDKWIAGALGSEDDIVLRTATQTLTNKTISGTSNTLTNIGNSSLTNSSITIAGTSTALGGSITAATILSGTGVVSGSYVSSISGTTNQVSVSANTGAVTLSLPQNIHTGASPTFAGLVSTGRVQIGGTDNRGVLTVQTGSTITYTGNTDPTDAGRFFVMENTDTSNTAGQYANITLQIAPTLGIGAGGRVLGDIRLVRTSTNSNAFFLFSAFRSDGTYKDYLSLDYTGATFAGTINGLTVSSGTISSGTWNGSVIGSSYGGAGTVNGILKANGSGTVSAAVAGTDYVTPSATFYIGTTSIAHNRASASQTLSGVSIDGNAGTATTLATARNIWGQSFNGSAAISGDLTGVGNMTFAADQTAYLIKTPSNGGAIRFRGNSAAASDRNVQLGHVDNAGNWSTILTAEDGGNVILSSYTTNGFVKFINGTGLLGVDTNTYQTVGSTFYVGTTAIANNRASASQTLTGVSIDGSAGSATSASYSTTLYSNDLRTISPSSHTAYRATFGFTSWANNNTSPWADYIHLRSYSDSSGGNDNLVLFRKDTFGIRIYQQTWGNSVAYSSYKDVAWTDGTNASGTWGINISGNAATVSNGVYTTSNNTMTGGNKIVIQNGTDGGSSRGLFMWTSSDTNWGIYMAQSGGGRSLADGTAATGLDGRATHHIRFRVANGSTTGFIWENSSEQALMSLSADNGDLYTKRQMIAGGDLITTNVIYPGYNGGTSGQQTSYYIYGNTANSGIRTNGNFLVNSNIYWGSQGVWLTDYLNQSVKTNGTPTFSTLTLSAGTGGGGGGTTALTVYGLSNYQSLELGITGNYDGMIRTYGNDLKIYAGHWRGTTTATEDHSIYFYTSKSGSSNWSTPKLTLDANANLTLAGVFTENSSIRYKENIITIDGGLDKVLQMRGVTYKRKDGGAIEAGVIAEEMNEVAPLVVLKNEEGEVDSVSYGRINAYLIEAIKDLKKELNEQNLIISDLKRKLGE